jgi:MFS family permease
MITSRVIDRRIAHRQDGNRTQKRFPNGHALAIHSRARPPLVGIGERRRGTVSRRGRCLHRQCRGPSIRADLHADAAEIQAVVAVYQIAYAALVITGGRLGDIAGRRRVFLAGVIGFTLASLWCGLTASAPMLIFARTAQGGAAALMVPQVLATIHTLFPDAARARAFAAFGVAIGLGAATGFMLGGWLVTLNLAGLGWRSIFGVNVPAGLAIVLAAAWLMPPMPRSRDTRLDLAGASA